jgi:hypothetical protein
MLKNRLPILLTMLAGFLMLLKFFLNVDAITAVADEIEQWCLIIFAMAVVLGVANISRINLRAVARKRPDWPYKLVLLGGMVGMAGVGFHDLLTRGDVAAGGLFYYFYETTYLPLASTMFALLAFFIASAAFRAFRARNTQAALLLIAGVFVMIGRVPLGAAISEYIPKMADWIMAVPNAAGQRALIMGAAMGVIATGLRILFGIERPFLRSEE